MAQLSTLIIAGAALLGAVQATQLHLNKGCIILNSEQLCSGSTGDLNDNDGKAAIYACFEEPVPDNLMDGNSKCQLLAEVPKEWGDVYFDNEDNCLYSADRIQLQCALHNP